MKEAVEQTRDVERGKRLDKMLEIVRNTFDKSLRKDLGLFAAEEVAKTVTRDNVVVWLKRRNQRTEEEKREEVEMRQREKEKREVAIRDAEWQGKSKEEIIKDAFELSRGSLAATLKRARLLTSQRITMDDVKKWRLENTNKEKKTNRKFYNSWVCNKAKDEYQVDLFYFQDLKKKQALKELLDERAQDDPEAARMIENNIPAPDAVAALPMEANAPPTRQQLKQRLEELTWEYESGLLVVDTFSKKIVVVPMKDRYWTTIKLALEKAFRELGGKPVSIYSDAEAAMTGKAAQQWFRQQGIVHNITLGHAPVAERMIGVIKIKIVEELGEPRQMWWTEVADVVNKYNKEHVSRSTKMTPDEAHDPVNTTEVKTNLESIRKMDNPQPIINVGDEVRVMVKKKFDKSYVPDWSDKTYKVKEKKEMNHALLEDDRPVDPQVMYKLHDPPRPLSNYKTRFMRHELLRVK